MESATFINDLADQLDVSVDWLMANAAEYQDSVSGDGWGGHYACHPDDSGRFEGMQGMISDEFWEHWQKLTGLPLKGDGSFLSCSC